MICKEKRPTKNFVYDMVQNNLDIKEEEALHKTRNNATKDF